MSAMFRFGKRSACPTTARRILGKIVGRAHRLPCPLSRRQLFPLSPLFEMFDFDLTMALAQIPVIGVLPSDFTVTCRGAAAVFDAVNRFRDARARVTLRGSDEKPSINYHAKRCSAEFSNRVGARKKTNAAVVDTAWRVRSDFDHSDLDLFFLKLWKIPPLLNSTNPISTTK